MTTTATLKRAAKGTTKNTSKTSGKVEVAPQAPKAKGSQTKAIAEAPKQAPAKPSPKAPQLAVTFRVMPLPASLWAALKTTTHKAKKSTREGIHEAIKNHLGKLTEELVGMGFNGKKDAKRLRLSLDADILGSLSRASGACGISMTDLLKLVLIRQLTE